MGFSTKMPWLGHRIQSQFAVKNLAFFFISNPAKYDFTFFLNCILLIYLTLVYNFSCSSVYVKKSVTTQWWWPLSEIQCAVRVLSTIIFNRASATLTFAIKNMKNVLRLSGKHSYHMSIEHNRMTCTLYNLLRPTINSP